MAALLHGFSTFDESTRIAGVILNRVGSARHEQVLRQACEHAGIPVLGALPRSDELAVPSRHLGLVTAVEHGGAARTRRGRDDRAGRRTCRPARRGRRCGRTRRRARRGRPQNGVGGPTGGGVTVAMAAGKAFSFCYAEHPELLRAAGADVVEFDPLTDRCRRAPRRWCCRADSPKSSAPNCPPTTLSAADRSARRRRRTGARRMRGPDLSGGRPRGTCDVRCARRIGAVHRPAHPGLPRRRRGGGFAAATPRATRVAGHEFHRTAVTFTDDYPPAWMYRGNDVAAVRDGAVHARRACELSAHPSRGPATGARPLRRGRGSL